MMNRPRIWTMAVGLIALLMAIGNAPANAGEAHAIVEKMIKAHGGMDVWAGAPSVSFTDVWELKGMPMPVKAHVIVEQGKRRAHLEYPDFNARIGWDGEQAWSLNWQSPQPPRFMALLNYFFVNLPWLMKDPGVVLHEPEMVRLSDYPVEYIAIRATYEAGVGDTPDDYYVLYIHPETFVLRGCAYVVTYPSLLPRGAKSTPEHVLIFDDFATVEGLKVPVAFTIYEEWEFYARCKISDWSFSKPFDPALVALPEGGVVDRSLDS